MSDALALVVSKLDAKEHKDYWMAKCPLHADSTESLKICKGDSQEVIGHCFAGCSKEAVTKLIYDITGSELKKKRGKKDRGVVVATYNYRETAEKIAYVKERIEFPEFPGEKEFRFKYQDENGDWIYRKPRGLHVLFGQPKLSRLHNTPVLICEGEKSALLVNECVGDSFIAITNDNGSTGWQKKFTDLLANREIYVAEDNDEPGRKRTSMLCGCLNVKGVVSFTTEVPKYDIYDRLSSVSENERLLEFNRLIANCNRDLSAVPKFVDKETPAAREDYLALVNKMLPEMGRDLFSGNLMYFIEAEEIWLPAENMVEAIESEAIEIARTTGPEFSPSHVIKHMKWYENQQKKKLLIDIPEWDGEDRIRFLCNQVKLKDVGLSQESFYQIVKSWLANTFRKLRDPSMNSSPTREFILVLSSKDEEIGKDYWLRSIFYGLGQWFSKFTVCQNERDNYMQLHETMILYISEFDRTNKLSAEFIKDIITADHTKLRGSHARKAEYRFSRCSFVATCNPNDILRDPGDNKRYSIFELETISRAYTKSREFSLQVLGQAQSLSLTDYVASEEALQEMRAYIKEKTPASIADEMSEYYTLKAQWFLNELKINTFGEYLDTVKRGYFTQAQGVQVLEMVSRLSRMSMRQVQNKLNSLGIKYRLSNSSSTGTRERVFTIPQEVLVLHQHALDLPVRDPVAELDDDPEQEEMSFV